MRREEVITRLAGHLDELRRRYALSSLRLFGSVARNEAGEESDVDILVEFSETPSLFQFLRLRGELEDILGQKVDLVTESGLKDRVRPSVLREAIRVA